MRELSSSRGRRLSVGASKIAMTLGLCLCAGQLVATPATASASTVVPAASAQAALAAAKVAPRVTIGANARTINWGSKVRFTAKVVDPRTGKAVRTGSVKLQAWRKGAWHNWETKRLSSAGTAAFTAEPHVTGPFRAVFSGAAGLRSAASGGAWVTVRNSGARILAEAAKHRGKAYRFGASGPRNFDCSGFTMYVYNKAVGKKLPHKANSQQKHGKAIAKAKAQPGDLIVIRRGSYGTHAGIYAGGGYIWASPRSGKTVGKQKIWNRSYVVRRLA